MEIGGGLGAENSLHEILGVAQLVLVDVDDHDPILDLGSAQVRGAQYIREVTLSEGLHSCLDGFTNLQVVRFDEDVSAAFDLRLIADADCDLKNRHVSDGRTEKTILVGMIRKLSLEWGMSTSPHCRSPYRACTQGIRTARNRASYLSCQYILPKILLPTGHRTQYATARNRELSIVRAEPYSMSYPTVRRTDPHRHSAVPYSVHGSALVPNFPVTTQMTSSSRSVPFHSRPGPALYYTGYGSGTDSSAVLKVVAYRSSMV